MASDIHAGRKAASGPALTSTDYYMSLRYIGRKLRKHGTDPQWWRNKLSIEQGVLPLYYELRMAGGENFFAQDWANVIILDACRFDLFQKCWDQDGKITRVRSLGSSTSQFLNRSAEHGPFPDTVYISSNPKTRINTSETFFEQVDVWRTDWDEELDTVHPEDVAAAAITAYEDYPHKRLVVHFMQPHIPFIRERALEHLESQQGIYSRSQLVESAEAPSGATPFDMLRDGKIDRETVWEFYQENLEVDLPSVYRLTDVLDAKTVITSDHENMLGERAALGKRFYGHPLGIRTPELVEVPWLELPFESQREVQTGEIGSQERIREEDVEDRLPSLGYVK